MPADTATLRRLSDLPPAERRLTERAIRSILARPENMGWEDWEFPELVASAARSQGVVLTSDDIAVRS
jgi:hypothetical protein